MDINCLFCILLKLRIYFMPNNKEIRLTSGFSGERYIHIPLPMLDLMCDQPLSKGLYLHSLGFFAHARYHYLNRPKGCNEYILIYCKEGIGNLTINNVNYRISANQAVVIPPHVQHRYEADHTTPWSIYWAHFMGTKAEEMSVRLYYPVEISISETSRIEDRLNLFEEIFNTIKTSYSIDNLNFANISFSYFLATFLHVEQFNQAKKGSEFSNNIISKVLHFMNENIENSLTIEQLASYSGYSPSYFYRRFISEMETPPMSYFMRMKINKASILLITTDMQVNQIASKVGFTDSFHFSRVFSKIIGMSPQSFRKQGFKL